MKLDEDEEEEIVIVEEDGSPKKEQIVVQIDNNQPNIHEVDNSYSPKKKNEYTTMQHDQLKYTPNKTPRHSELKISRESPQNGGSIQPRGLVER